MGKSIGRDIVVDWGCVLWLDLWLFYGDRWLLLCGCFDRLIAWKVLLMPNFKSDNEIYDSHLQFGFEVVVKISTDSQS